MLTLSFLVQLDSLLHLAFMYVALILKIIGILRLCIGFRYKSSQKLTDTGKVKGVYTRTY